MAVELSEQTRALVRSRIPNYAELNPREAAEAAIKVIAADFHIYCERNLMIKDKRGQITPLQLNWAQKILVEMVLRDIAEGRPVRYIILKARQMGLSTAIEALCFWWVTTHKNQNAVIIAHKKKAAKNLYKMFKRYYEHAHEHFRPDLKYNTKDDLTFDVADEIKAEYRTRGEKPPGLASEIQTMVADEGEGRSDTILFFHGSEVAHWKSGSDVLSSSLQAVPLLPYTFAFLESTANGVGGYFYDEWQFAKKGESAFKPLFFAWHEHPEYMLEGKIDVYDDEERELLEIFKDKGYDPDTWDKKLIWRREKKKEFRSEPDKFYQEYPKDDTEAFLASGRPVFDIRQLQRMEEVAQLPQSKPKYGIIAKFKDDHGVEKYGFEELPQTIEGIDPSPLKVWDMPDKGEKYVIGIDTSEGIEKGNDEKRQGDYSVIDVTRVRDLKTVARWRGHIDPDLLGDEAVAIGSFYNYALIGPEINNHGLTTAQRIRNLFYRNLYQRESSEEEQFQERTSKMGWKTDRKTKPLMINELGKAIRESDIIDLDIVFIRECMTYVRDDNGYTGAQENMFDDCVMAKAIALQLANWNSYDMNYAKESIFKPTKRNTNATSSTSSTDTLDYIATGVPRRQTNRDVVSRRRQARRRHRRESRV